MESLFIIMFVTCSAALLYYLLALFRKRDTMAPQAHVHDDFVRSMERSPWPKAAQELGLECSSDEPEILLCRHRLQGRFQGREVRVRCYDRKHAGILGRPSALRVSFHQKLPVDGIHVDGGVWVERVHGAPSLCYTSDTLLGQGPRLGRKAIPLRPQGDWLEIEASAPPDQLKQILEQVLALYSSLERASHPEWVLAAERHGLRLEWERGRRHPRLSGLLGDIGVRASVLEGVGVRILLVCEHLKHNTVSELPGARQEHDRLTLLLPQSRVSELSSLLDKCLATLS